MGTLLSEANAAAAKTLPGKRGEPLREPCKDEVRALGHELGRQPTITSKRRQ
jgi:GMP synthase PP-ATPase subunit